MQDNYNSVGKQKRIKADLSPLSLKRFSRKEKSIRQGLVKQRDYIAEKLHNVLRSFDTNHTKLIS